MEKLTTTEKRILGLVRLNNNKNEVLLNELLEAIIEIKKNNYVRQNIESGLLEYTKQSEEFIL